LFANPYIKHYKAYLKQIRKKSEEVKNYIDLSMLHMNLNNIDESLAVQEQMRERFPERADLRALYALMLGGLGRKEEAREKWGETVGILLDDPDSGIKFRPVGESSNEVMEYMPKKFFRKALLIKRPRRSSPESVRKDYAINEALYSIISASFYKKEISCIPVPEPISIITEEPLQVLTRRIPSKDLNSLFYNKENPSPEYFKILLNVVYNLGLVQGIATRNLSGNSLNGIELQKFDYAHEIYERIFKRFGRSEHSEKITEYLLNHIYGNKNNLEFFIEGDFYSSNALEEGIILDFERAAIGDPVCDISMFLSSIALFDNEGLFNNYVQSLSKHSCQEIDPARLRQSMNAHLIFYTFCLSGSRIYHNDSKRGLYFIGESLRLSEEQGLDELKEHIIKYAKENLCKSL
jgi:tetratricopeptide (TPR) repeat protein